MSYAPPAGPPPSHPSTARPPPASSSPSLDPTDGVPDDPPPAYTPSAGYQGDTTVQAGPSRMDFSGPPPMPDRLNSQQTGIAQHLTGVGEGFGRRPPHALGAQQTGWSEGGAGGGRPFVGNGNGNGTGNGDPFVGNGEGRPGPPPQHPSRVELFHSTSSNKPGSGAGAGGVGGGSGRDLSPTEVPTPGRPLLHNGMMLVYPKGHLCQKCGNTGYKSADPSNPCNSDWRKYGKPFNAALAASYATHASSPLANPTTSASSNFQQPLPSHPPPAGNYHHPPPPQANPYGHLPPPPGKWHAYPGQGMGPGMPPPPPHMGMGMGMGQPQAGPIYAQNTPGPVPPHAVVVGPGDPRIGGMLCRRCGGDGREYSFFGFDDGRCWDCHGLGRMF